MSILIDTRGRSCPEPVMMTKQALDQDGNEELEILSDNKTALENITRYVKNAGLEMEVEEKEDEFVIMVKRK